MTRRRRRRPPIGWIVFLLVGGVIIGWAIRGVVRRMTAVPAPVVDYATLIEELATASAPAGTNGWPALARALDQFAAVEAAAADGAAAGPAALVDRLEAAGVPETLAAVARAERFLRPLDRSTPLVFNPNVTPAKAIRALAQARGAAMRRAAAAGDDAARIAAFEQTLAIARACAGQPTVVDRLLAGAVAALALEELRIEARTDGLDDPTAVALIAAMDRQLAWPPFSMAFEGERLALHDLIQASFTDDGHGDGQFSPDLAATAFGATSRGNPFAGIGGMFLARRTETTRVVDAYIDQVIADAAVLPPARTFDSDRFMDGYSRRYVIAKALLPGISHAVRIDDIHALRVTATRVVIAVERFRALHGGPPATLADLAPWLAGDPIDPLHGGPLVYRRDPAATGGYVLYSTGYDAVDDSAGQPALGVIDGPATRAGTDVLLTRDREP